MRAKEFLSVRGIDYDSIDVTKNPDRLDAAVAKFGLKVLPLVVRGDRAINGQNLSDLASLIDESYDDTPVLSPDALVARTDAFMEACRRYAAQFPPDLFNAQLPYRDWDYRKLVHHVFHISEVFVNQMSGAGEPPGAAFEMPIPDRLDSFGALIEYGEEKRKSLAAWWASPDRLDMSVSFTTRAGTRSAHQVLERMCWHIGQHVRQVEHMIVENGIVPDGALTRAMLDKLPLPTNVWSDL